MTPLVAAKFANIAAGLVVRKTGTATVSFAEMEPALYESRLMFE
jgi:bifunctional ADP-heptose synthase (sugar kinase/adenylyltransferase)